MTITYPQSTKAKQNRLRLPPVAPTPALRADAALADAHRYLGVGMGQALIAAMFAVLLSNIIQQDLGAAWFIVCSIFMFAILAASIWASMQGQSFGTARYSSGQNYRARGAAKYVMIAALGVFALSLLVPVAMFFAWERNIPFPFAEGLMQLAMLVGQLLLSVFMSLRAIDALKYARAQVLESAGGTDSAAGTN